MDRTSHLRKHIEEENLDAFLIRDSSENPNLYYLSQFKSSDPYMLVQHRDKTILIVAGFEKTRAEKESAADQVLTSQELREDNEKVISGLIERFKINTIGIPKESSVKLYQDLREETEIVVTENPAETPRSIKEAEEIENIETAQKAAEKAMRTAKEMIRDSRVEDGKLILDGKNLTSERVKREIQKTLIDNECKHSDTIVASGLETANPHQTGKGAIKPEEPVIVDIFPQHSSRYHGDMTRTFAKGEPSEEVQELHRDVKEAQKAAFEVLEKGSGANVKEVEKAVCDRFNELGYETYRENSDEGFIHSIGHGVGLKVHEKPSLTKDKKLEAGNVITVEPGLYYPDIGGVRIEDLIVIEEDGYRNLNSMDKDLVI